MGRGKLPLRLIEKERARRITCAKRKKGLAKKAYELATLCDVRVCLVIRDPESSDGNCLKTFPENPNEVAQIVSDYFASRAKNPNNSSSAKRDLTLSDFFSDRLRKLRSESEKEKHREGSDCSVWDSRIDSFSRGQLLELVARLDRKIQEVDEANKVRLFDREKAIMAVSDDCRDDHNNLLRDYQHQGSSSSGIDDNSSIAMAFDHQNPWTMNNLSYYTRLLEAPDLSSFGNGMGFDIQSSSSSTLSNSNNNNNINNYYYPNADVAASMYSYPGAIQYFPAEQFYGGAAVYDYTVASSGAGGFQEEVKFCGNASQLGFGKSSFFGV